MAIKRGDKLGGEISSVNVWNIIPVYLTTCLLCIMSYWHGHSEAGWGRIGLLYNIILGFVFAVFVIKLPIFR